MSNALPEERHNTAMTAPARILLVPRPEQFMQYLYQSITTFLQRPQQYGLPMKKRPLK